MQTETQIGMPIAGEIVMHAVIDGVPHFDSSAHRQRVRVNDSAARRSRWRGMSLLVAFIAALMSVTTIASAQGWTLVGSVKDELGQPIEGAEILVGSMDARARSDIDGRFRISGVTLGLTFVGARRIGFLPVADLIQFSPSDSIELVLDRVAQRMDTLKVMARAEAMFQSDMRRYASAADAARTGNVITERDIAERRTPFTSDLVLIRPGFRVVGDGANARVLSTRSRCAASIVLDGNPMQGVAINDIAPSSIKLMVLYPGLSSLPAELQSIRINPACGVISIYSR